VTRFGALLRGRSLALLALVGDGATAKLDFNRDVRPILADRCFRCHGPDGGARKRGLRLDTEDGSRATLASGLRAIVPGSSKESELVVRITSEDPDERMPPLSLNRPLDAEQKRILVQWIEEGGAYAKHWAYVPPQRAALPDVKGASWVRDPLDRFVLARLEKEGLAPAPEADRATLLRRVSLVLTGLPPTPTETARFVADETPEAYEHEVERCLASPRFGEHMAAAWLDGARYADTFGYQSDWDCETWPWRDWVIAAFNRDLAYDEFVREQIAGDLVPGATREQVLATAFNRLNRLTNEGGSIDEECRQETLADRVGTFGTVFLGLTTECARCHDHKYDPISQREFYSLAAFFGAADEAGTYAYSHRSTPPPALALPTAEQEAALAKLDSALSAAEVRLARTLADRHAAFLEWRKSAPRVALTPPVKCAPLDGDIEGPGPGSRARLFDGDSGVSLDGVPAFRRADPYSLAFFMRCPEAKERATILHTSPFTIETDPQGYQVLLEHARLAWQVVHFWPGSAAAIRTREPFPLGRWVHVVLTYDGSSRAEGLTMHLDGQRVPFEIERDHLDGAATARLFQVGFRDRDLGFAGGALDELDVYDRALTEPEITELERAGSGAASAELESYFTCAVDPRCRAAREELHAARVARNELADSLREIMVMGDTPQPRPSFVLRRGVYDDPDPARPVASDHALDALLPFDPSWPKNRLGLARWLTDARNPLAARVQVNRLWSQCFGRGLVATQENFGLQGEYPSHPELLDTLALDFVAAGWSPKALLRRLVLSATFRQSSDAAAELRARDRDNVWLARGPAFRLSAEMLRDQALFLSGTLVEALGGPSVRPWQPPGLWEDAGASGSYVPDTGASAHRRSLYTFRKRTSPPPDLLLFDAGSREKCLARRATTNTPLQALVLLNDPVYVECARELARLVTREASTTEQRLELALRRVAAREARPVEREALRDLFASELARFQADPACARALVTGNEPSPELAALTLVCSTLLASDAAVMLR
jgi:cytochrome c553